MEKLYRTFIRLFLVMGIICVVMALFGAVHQLVFAFVCFIIYGLLKCELKEKKEECKQKLT